MHDQSNSVVTKIGTLALLLVPLAGTVLAAVLAWNHIFEWRDLTLLVVFYVLTSLGITIGYHRYLCHRGFRPHPVLKVVLVILGCMAMLGAPIDFVGTHRKHHALSDRGGDPHSPLEGFFHAHMGWIFHAKSYANRHYARDLIDDPVVAWINQFFPIWVVLGMAVPLALGGWQGLLWGGFVRMFLVHHVTWGINSVCHTFGGRPFRTRDRSTNEWVMAVLALGEGWHNNHHAFPRSALHGLRWWQVDVSGLLIRLLGRLRLAHEIQRVTAAEMRQRFERQASGEVA